MLLEVAEEHGVNLDDYADSSMTPEMLETIQSLARELQSRQHKKGYSRDDIVELSGVPRLVVDRILDGNPNVRTRAVYAIAELLELPLGFRQRLPLDEAMVELASKFSEKSNLEADVIDQLRHANTPRAVATLAGRFLDQTASDEALRNLVAESLQVLSNNVSDSKETLAGVADTMHDALMRGLEGGLFKDLQLADGRMWKPVPPARTLEGQRRRQVIQEIAHAKVRNFASWIRQLQKDGRVTEEELKAMVAQSPDSRTGLTTEKIAEQVRDGLVEKSMTVDELADETGISTYEFDLILSEAFDSNLLAVFAAGEVLGFDLQLSPADA
ncbi:MAG: hypothetical protein ACPG77_13615 [Nannocystaceae bacterium]